MSTIDYEVLKRLPDAEKEKIANILMGDARNRLGGSRLRLEITNRPLNHSVEFWRVSSTDQRDGYSLGAQETKSGDYKKDHGLKSARSWSVSESASKEFDRKKFFEMIDYVTTYGIKNIVFDKIDRACRGLRAAVLIEDLIESGVRFHFVRDNLIVDKKSSPSEKLRFYLGVVLAKWYIDNLKTEIKKGLDARVAEGYFNAKAPLGYVNVRPEFGKANLEIHPIVGPFISECFELYKTGNYSRKDLEKLGLEKGVKWITKRRTFNDAGESEITTVEKHVTTKALEKILTNPTYCQHKRLGGKVVSVPNAKWPGIISHKTFLACQKIKGIRAKGNQLNLAAKVNKPLMQLMNCGVCSHIVTGEVKRKKTGRTYIYYHCANTLCSQRSINTEQKKLFAQFEKAFEPFARFTPKATTAFIASLRERLVDMSFHSIDKVGELRDKQFKLKQRIEEVDKLESQGLLLPEEKESILGIKNEEIEVSEIEIDAHVKADRKILEKGLNIIELLKNASDFMKLDGYELEKARLLKSMLSNLTLRDGSIEFYYKKPFDDLLFLTGGRNWWIRPPNNKVQYLS
jgi:site-specific DNA recombinase